MGTTPKWERGAHLELSTDEKLDYLYTRDDAQQDEIDANKVKVTPATYPEGTETYNIATIKVGNTTKTLKGKEGGGGSSDAFEVKFTVEYDEQSSAYIAASDKTYSEINAAYTANKNIYAWMNTGNANDTTHLTTGYCRRQSGIIFYFNDKNEPGCYERWQITVGTESITAFISYEAEPVYILGDYSDGDTLDETTLEVYNTAYNLNLAPVYINIGVGSGYGTFIFHSLYGGYCFAGSADAIGATASINSGTGEITVTAPNS